MFKTIWLATWSLKAHTTALVVSYFDLGTSKVLWINFFWTMQRYTTPAVQHTGRPVAVQPSWVYIHPSQFLMSLGLQLVVLSFVLSTYQTRVNALGAHQVTHAPVPGWPLFWDWGMSEVTAWLLLPLPLALLWSLITCWCCQGPPVSVMSPMHCIFIGLCPFFFYYRYLLSNTYFCQYVPFIIFS